MGAGWGMDAILLGVIIALFIGQTWLLLVMVKGISGQMEQGLQNIRTELAEIVSKVLESEPVIQLTDEIEPLQRLKGILTIIKEFAGPPELEPAVIETVVKSAMTKDAKGRFSINRDN